MNNDELIWQIVGKRFCSFRVKTNMDKLCRNEYNLTVKEHLGVIYLYVKTAERAHMPSKLWEKIKMPSNYSEALRAIDKELIYWPSWIKHKCKQRLTKIVQYLIRMRKLKLKGTEKLVGIKKKSERRLKTREIRAEQVARLDKSIEKELLERLKSKAYGEDMPLNIKQDVWEQILAENEVEDEDQDLDSDAEVEIGSDGEFAEMDGDFAEDEDGDEDEDEDEYELEREFVSDVSDVSDVESGSDDFGDIEDFAGFADKSKNKNKSKSKSKKYEIEYELEHQNQNQRAK